MKNPFILFCLLIVSNLFSQNPTWVLFDHTNAPFTNDSITCVKVDTNNVKWVGTHSGLFKFHNNVWTEYNTSNSNIPSNDIDKFEIAYDNTIWFTNNGNGFYKFRNNIFTLYDQSNLPALYTHNFKGLTLDSNDVFLWSDTSGVVKFNSITNAVYNINTSNSCLKTIKKLVSHGNHTIYGLTPYPTVPGLLPQNHADSIAQLNDFKITNTSTLSISYCFATWHSPCTYLDVFADRYGHRFEVASMLTIFNRRLRIYDKDNTLLSDIQYNQYPEYQFAQNTYGFYSLEMGNTIIHFLNVTIFNPLSYYIYHPANSMIPPGFIENFDIDTLNNVWLATAKGLVGYNDMGVITGLEEKSTETISAYPNPAQQQLTFRFENGDPLHTSITLTNALGVFTATYTADVVNKRVTINLTNVPNGIYYYTIIYDQKILNGKIAILK